MTPFAPSFACGHWWRQVKLTDFIRDLAANFGRYMEDAKAASRYPLQPFSCCFERETERDRQRERERDRDRETETEMHTGTCAYMHA